MLVRKLQLSAIIGGVLGVFSFFMALSEGNGLRDAFAVIPGAIMISVIGVFWFTRNMDAEGNEMQPTTSDQIYKLQNQLRGNLEAAAHFESRGEYGSAQHLRAQAAVIESQLRRLGA